MENKCSKSKYLLKFSFDLYNYNVELREVFLQYLMHLVAFLSKNMFSVKKNLLDIGLFLSRFSRKYLFFRMKNDLSVTQSLTTNLKYLG